MSQFEVGFLFPHRFEVEVDLFSCFQPVALKAASVSPETPKDAQGFGQLKSKGPYLASP